MVTVKIDWIKMQTDMYDNPKIKVIDSMEDNNLIHYIWTRSILLAGKSNMGGDLYLTSKMPYTMKTLAIEFNRTVEEVKRAYRVLLKFEMIELTEDKVFRIKNWSKYQNIDGLEKIRKQNCARVAKYREKKREEKRAAEAENSSEELKDDSKKNSKSNDDFDKSSDKNDSESFKIDNNSSDESEAEDVKKIDEEVKSNRNVTCNDDNNNKCNKTIVTVMQENKKETKKKNKKKKKREKDNEEDGVSQSDDISLDVIELSNYCEEITGRVGALDVGALKLLVNMHGKENVKKAINKAIELGKTNMPYISGILSNWRKEGYPNDDVGGNKYGGKCNNKGNEPDSNKLKDFKPKEPRKLSEEERKKASASVV